MRIVCLLLSALVAFAQEPAPSTPQTKPTDERETPRGTFVNFLRASIERDYRRASSFLDLTQSRRTGLEGAELARMLKYVLDRKVDADPARLSNTPEGDLTDGLPPDQDLLGTVSRPGENLDLLLQRVKRGENLIWLVSAETVAGIPEVYRNLGESMLERHLPAWITAARGPLDTALWQWLALLVLGICAFLGGRLLSRIVTRGLGTLVKRTSTSLDDDLAESLAPPFRILLAVILFRAGLVWIVPAMLLRVVLSRVLATLAFLTLAWLLSRAIDVISTKALVAMSARHRAGVSSVMPLVRRTIKVVLFTFAVIASLDAWGFDTTAVLAGLGVGGLAVALAAQKTIENLFGGVAITTDKPVLVGDFCRYNDKVGTIEDIGLRSTRIRTLERTVVTIPNAQFSAMELENFGRRDKIWFHPTLGLRRDTSPQQLRQIIPAIRQVLLDHLKVDPNPARVRFTGVGDYSLNLEIFAYVLTADFDEFLVIQEELLLKILDVLEEAGTSLAIPQQLTLLARDPIQRSRQTEIVRDGQARRSS